MDPEGIHRLSRQAVASVALGVLGWAAVLGMGVPCVGLVAFPVALLSSLLGVLLALFFLGRRAARRELPTVSLLGLLLSGSALCTWMVAGAALGFAAFTVFRFLP